MSRREIVINTLCGALILMAMIVLFLLFAAPLVFAIHWLPKFFAHFFPGVRIPESAVLFVVFGVSSLVSLVSFMRRRIWQNAFLSFVVVAVVFSGWLAQTRQPQSHDDFIFGLVPLILLIPMRGAAQVPRLNFILGSIFGATFLAFNFGLVPGGSTLRELVECTAGVYLMIRFSQGWNEKSPAPQAPLTPTSA